MGEIIGTAGPAITMRFRRFIAKMSNIFTTVDQSSSVILAREAVDALGVEVGSELEIEIVGRALVIRSVEESRLSGEFMNASTQSSPDVLPNVYRSAV